jgi:hypothetical protein
MKQKDDLFLRENMIKIENYLGYLGGQGERWRRRDSNFSGSS